MNTMFIIVVSIVLLSAELVYHEAVKAYGQEDQLEKSIWDFMNEPITNDSQKVKSTITEQEYNIMINDLNKLLESNGRESINLPYKESCYYHEDDKFLYETYQCLP